MTFLLLKEVYYKDKEKAAFTKAQNIDADIEHFFKRYNERVENCKINALFLKGEDSDLKTKLEEEIKKRVISHMSNQIQKGSIYSLDFGALIFGEYFYKYNNETHSLQISVSDGRKGLIEGNIYWSPIYKEIAKTIMIGKSEDDVLNQFKRDVNKKIDTDTRYTHYKEKQPDISKISNTKIVFNIELIIKELTETKKNIVDKNSLPYIVKSEYRSDRGKLGTFELKLGEKTLSFMPYGFKKASVHNGKYESLKFKCDSKSMADLVESKLKTGGIKFKRTDLEFTVFDIYSTLYFTRNLKENSQKLTLLKEKLEKLTNNNIVLISEGLHSSVIDKENKTLTYKGDIFSKEQIIEINTHYEGYLINVNGNVILKAFELENIPVRFGKVIGSFNCSSNKLTSLKNSPYFIGRVFNCHENLLENLDYLPKHIGSSFDCSKNKLISLKGCASEINGDFNCSYNFLTTLEYSPSVIKVNFDCSYNKLITLKGCPQNIGDTFSCTSNNLKSLKFGPTYVGSSYDCSRNQIETIEFMPEKINGDFWFQGNKIKITKEDILNKSKITGDIHS